MTSTIYVSRPIELPDTWVTRHPDDEYYDRITIDVVPRWKESGLSGDEWRVSAVIKFWRKGNVVYEQTYRDLKTALAFAPSLFITARERQTPGEFIAPRDDQFYCAQPGCSNLATVEYRLKKEFCNQGHGAEPAFKNTLRRFCDEHKTRGDCGLEDADDNYELVGRIVTATSGGDR